MATEAPRVAALYRHPLKGFTPESCEAITVRADGRVEGDRVLAFLLGDAPSEAPQQAAGADWWPKAHMLALVNTPALARLTLRYDEAIRRVSISLEGALLVEDTLDATGRLRIAEAVGAWAREQREQPDLDRPGRLPLRLIGDGVTPRYQDNATGNVTLHGRGSLRALADALDDPALDEQRFRSNIVVEGLEAWGEFDWVDQAVRIGGVTFDVLRPAVRCLATHASPSEGVRDREVMTTLVSAFGHERPSFAVHMLPREGGQVRLGDPVEVVAAR
ncbi:MAG: MOSC domain-containing protein [Dehalococcoidia bacterium]